MIQTSVIRFESLSSAPDASFWHTLSKRKLHDFKLDSSPREIVATFTSGRPLSSAPDGTPQPSLPPCILLGHDSFDSPFSSVSSPSSPSASGSASSSSSVQSPSIYTYSVPGTLVNVNTIEEFKRLDKSEFIKTAALSIRSLMHSDAGKPWYETPELLTRFSLLSFADLKTHKFYYWFAFPALLPKKSFTFANPQLPFTSLFSPSAIQNIKNGFKELRIRDVSSGRSTPSTCFAFFYTPSSSSPGQYEGPVEVLSLSQLFSGEKAASIFSKLDPNMRLVLGFVDPGSHPSSPSWIFRNTLAACGLELRTKFSLSSDFLRSQVDVLALREFPQRDSIDHSLYFGVVDLSEFSLAPLPHEQDPSSSTPAPAFTVGWEKNAKGDLAPRQIDLGSMMDPLKLAESSTALNLQLMKWRAFPQLQTDVLAAQKCLLVGSGTLGCNVSRQLLAWGVRKITFLDYGKVSYSNPARQSLFTFEDSAAAAPKAQAAAKRLKEVFPGVQAEGIELSIPMPGHGQGMSSGSAAEKQVRDSYEKLYELVKAHDVIFLLTDTRESRWLPTLMCAAEGKLCINAALGFDSYVVMRHGVHHHHHHHHEGSEAASSKHDNLGCYFCSDVVAPRDSMTDRTLDMQCTVTRPGVSAMASALAVELLVSLLHHPLRERAPASQADESSPSGSPLGLVPHQLRGQASSFGQMILTGRQYSQCTACSPIIVSAFKERGFELLKEAMNNPQSLEDLTGLTELHKKAEAADADWESMSEDDEEDA